MDIMKPSLRGHFHQAMFFVSLGACILLIISSEAGEKMVSSAIFSMGTLLMFGISSLYHRITWKPKHRAIMRRLDHSAIFIMIAGTSTPIALTSLSSESGSEFLTRIWIVAILGVLQSIFFVNIPKFVSAIIYLIAGYMVIPYVSELFPRLGGLNSFFLVAGGVAYSLGALSYALKRPKLLPRHFGYHEVFHLLVSIGAILHFILVYSIVKTY